MKRARVHNENAMCGFPGAASCLRGVERRDTTTAWDSMSPMKHLLWAIVGAIGCLSSIAPPVTAPPKDAPIGGSLSPAPNTLPILLYEEALDAVSLTGLVKSGAQSYFVIYQNNADPSAQKTGVIDSSALGRAVISQEGETPTGWGVLDYEEPFGAAIQEGPQSPKYAALVQTMIDAIRSVKRAFPKVKWTYYGIPGLRYYIDGKSWSELSEVDRKREIDKQLAAWGPVMAECDWLAPCIYNVFGDGKGSRSAPLAIRKSTREWSEARTHVAVRFIADRKLAIPVIPFVSPIYMPDGGARTYSVVPDVVLVEDTIDPAFRGGASGLCFWSGASYLIRTTFSSSAGITERRLLDIWSQDLGIDRISLSGEDGKRRITEMLATCQLRGINAARSRWSSLKNPHP